MKFSMIHENYNVSDLARSLEFYRQALGLEEVRRKEAADGSFIIVYVAVPGEPFELELTWLRDHPQKYENPAMGIYFIQDPDGYWLEIVPTRK